jgi:hypothetical protein
MDIGSMIRCARLLLLISTAILSLSAVAQPGCTDPFAANYDPSAVSNNGSCQYPAYTMDLIITDTLPSVSLDENSGLFYRNGQIWTHVDDTRSELYSYDIATGSVNDTLSLPGITNVDWEDLSADNRYLYLGDIGNNSGSRSVLRFYRIPLGALDTPPSATLTIETVTFSYPASAGNLDAEGFVVMNDTIHLFSKEWAGRKTRHFTIPAKTSGLQTAEFVEELNVNGVITGAAMNEDGVIILLGYDSLPTLSCFTWLLYDYAGSRFFSGNKRRLEIGSVPQFGQTEGITFAGSGYGYFSNERFRYGTFLDIPPRLYRFDLTGLLPEPMPFPTADSIDLVLYPQPANQSLHIRFGTEGLRHLSVFNAIGESVWTGTTDDLEFDLSMDGFPRGILFLQMTDDVGANTVKKFVLQ